MLGNFFPSCLELSTEISEILVFPVPLLGSILKLYLQINILLLYCLGPTQVVTKYKVRYGWVFLAKCLRLTLPGIMAKT